MDNEELNEQVLEIYKKYEHVSPDQVIHSLSELLARSFSWHLSKKGQEYWQYVYHMLHEAGV